MKRFCAISLVILMVLSIVPVMPHMESVTASAAKRPQYEYGDNSQDMIEKWFGDEVTLFSMDSESEKERVKAVIQSYMEIRRQSLYDYSSVEAADFISDEIIEVENERRDGFSAMADRMDAVIENASNNVRFDLVKKTDDGYTADVYEWVFYDYSMNESNAQAGEVSGFGTSHVIVLEETDEGFVIISDEYDELDMNGICTAEREDGHESEYSYPEEDEDEEVLLMASFYSGYDPESAVEYSDRYATDYNDYWPNYNSVGGDCANFTSQAIYAGGMPMVECEPYGLSGWYHYSSTNRSATWTGAGELRYYLRRNRGLLVQNPTNEDIYYGSPVFYDYQGSGENNIDDWDHAVLCVGRNNSGVPIINSHNNDRFHVVWTYASGVYSTVQLTANPGFDGEGVNTSVKVTGVSLNETALYMEPLKYGTYTLKATVYPSNATNKDVSWKSSNTNVVKVSSSGKVTAVGEGGATITVTTADGNYKAECYVSVLVYHVGSISLDRTSLTLEKGDTYTLTETITPQYPNSYVTDDSVTWFSNNTSVATVTSSGKVTAKGYGNATITVTTEDGNKTASCYVTVPYYAVTDVTLSKSYVELDLGKSTTLTASVYPTNATNPDILWETSDKTIATVSNGKVTAKKGGTVTITARSDDNYYVYDTCTVKVIYNPVTSVTLNNTSLVLSEGQTYQLQETIYPYNATYKDVTWTTSDKKVATVTSAGKVTAKGEGTAYITVTTEDMQKTATCMITVKHIDVESVSLDRTQLELIVKDTYTLTATVLPLNASNPNIIWTTSDKSVATVTKGKITAKGNGTAVITATSDDNEAIFASCTVTVKEYVWSYAEGKLTIKGKGVIEDFASVSEQPWYEYRSNIEEIEIGSGITAIGKNAFRELPNLRKAAFPTTVKSIGYAAFYKCAALSEISSLKKVVYVGDSAFSGCSELSEFDIPDKMEYIGAWAFSATGISNWKNGAFYMGVHLLQTGSSLKSDYTVAEGTKTIASKAFKGGAAGLKSVVIADSVTTICPDAFIDCTSLESVTLGKNIKTFDGSLFRDCTSLAEFKLSDTNKTFSVEDGVLYNKSKTTLVRYPVGKKGDTFILPEKVTTIAEGAFSGCDIDEIILPAKLKTVADGAFSDCSVGLVQYMKYEKDWAKVKIGEGNDALTNAEIRYLVAVEQVSFDEAEIAVGLKSGHVDLGDAVTVYPSNATNKSVTWKSSGKTIASVDEDGFVTLLKSGTVTITAASVEGSKKAACKITVIDDMIHVTAVSISEDTLTLDVSDRASFRLSAAVYPSNADIQEVTWSSSGKSVVSVDEDGLVTPLKKGSATITVTSVDSKKKAVCKVTVTDSTVYATKVTVSQSKASIYEGEELSLTATVSPDNVTDDTVIWTSSNTSVAKVDDDGNVTALKKGSATITATSADGKKKATCKVTVLDPTVYATKVTLNTKKETMYVGDEIRLEATVSPDNATYDYVTWKSSKPSVATVDDDGNVTAIKKGSATITATSADGKKKATCKITVKN